jgi:hypothetical protein
MNGLDKLIAFLTGALIVSIIGYVYHIWSIIHGN